MKKTTAVYFESIRKARGFAGGCCFVPALLVLFLGGCADFFQDRVPMQAGRSGSLETLINPPRAAAIEKLLPPGQFFVGTGDSPRHIRLSWSKVTGASTYIVERAVVEPQVDGSGTVAYPPPADEDFEILDDQVSVYSYTDEIFGTGNDPVYTSPEYQNRYYYRIRSENAAARLEPSNATAAQWGGLFAPPRNVRASGGDFNEIIELEWQGADRASAYDVYRSDSNDGASALLRGRISGIKYRDTVTGTDRGRDFYYFVKAVNSAGVSIPSGLAMGYSLAEGAPPKPGNAGLAPGSGQGDSTTEISITWSAVPGAINYVVYRYTNEDNALVKLGEPAGTSFTDTYLLKAQVYYYYKVQAIVEAEGVLVKGAFSDSQIEAFILGPPRNAEADQEDGGTVAIKWFPALGGTAEQAVYSYEIHGASSYGGPYSLVQTVSAPASAQADGYIHAGNVPAWPFYYIVTKKGLVQSDPGTEFAPFAKAAVNLYATAREYIPDTTPNDSAVGVYPVKITWEKPGGEVPAAYHVYRSTAPDSGFRALTSSPVPAAAETGGEFTWLDEDVTMKPGVYYYYRVLSLNALDKGRHYSETRQGYGALTHEAWFKEYIKTVNKSLTRLVNMNKPNALDKLGDETKSGGISGTISYDSPDSAGEAAGTFTIYIEYSNYAEFYIGNDSSLGLAGRYFILNGNSNTTVNGLTGSGSMNGTVTATGMYPGTVGYGSISIVSQEARGGTYAVTPAGGGTAAVSWELGKR
ncbi:MAG: hypothetical protein LBK27_07225 [Treponema sp.]|jgi:hypothetical protein|nr:hypothetical protein [Treponema sp.]